MKRFLRTAAGKTLIFMLCILSLCTFCASAVGIVAITTNNDVMYFYERTEEEIIREQKEDTLYYLGYDCLWRYAAGRGLPDDGNCYQILNQDGSVAAQSANAGTVKTWDVSMTYGVVKDGDYVKYLYNVDETEASQPSDPLTSYYTVRVMIMKDSMTYRNLENTGKVLHILYGLRYTIYIIAAVSLILTAVTFVILMNVSGHRPDTEMLVPGPLERVPYDVLTAAAVLSAIGAIYMIKDFRDIGILEFYAVAAVTLYCVSVFLGLCMSAASRIKRHTLVSHSLTYKVLLVIWFILCRIWDGIKKIFSYLGELLRNLPLIWKSTLFLLCLTILELIGIAVGRYNIETLLIGFFAERIILIPVILYAVLLLQRLKKGGKMLAEGDLAYQINTKGMYLDLKEHAEDLNSIAKGMSIAVDERTKSERMKAELITNVSHDIKTPLTSIINYTSLIADEPCENETITEYTDVLMRQSEKLKRLIDDLVEASKASTGNLDVCLAPCDASIFVTQAAGEYEEKLRASDLTLVTKLPEKEISINADGRRMWRIFDNLMNNICKYSLPGTRVYLTLEEQGGQAVFTFKNTSREELDMSEEELMERFTRGDSSRSTEGNGLGLSIARSMAELQNGTLRIATDGDLFKAVLSFPER